MPNAVMAKEPDRHLVDRFKAGSREAMETIVERYQDRIFTFGMKMCRHLEDAEDITQETFLNAFRYLNGFRGETKLRNWLFKIAARSCMRRRRKKKGEPDHKISLDSFMNEDGAPGGYDIPDWSDDPADYFLRAELKEVIDSAISSLPPKYRMVFSLRDIEGFNTKETAEILEISTQSVKTRLHRARHFLRERISAYRKEGAVQ